MPILDGHALRQVAKFFQAYLADGRDLNLVPPDGPVALVVLREVELHVLLVLPLEAREMRLPFEETPERLLRIDKDLLARLGTALVNPREFLLQCMVDILVEVIGGDKTALLLIENAAPIQAVQPDIAGDVLVCEEAADSKRTANLILLTFVETEFGLEGFEQPFHLLSASLRISATHGCGWKTYG